jgi:hypothetical protein
MSNNKEITRFSLFAKKDCIENILAKPGDITRDAVSLILDDVNRQLASGGKKRVSTTPRKLSPYNYFVKAKLPELSKQFPEIDNRMRMSKVSELWKNLSPAEKESFKPPPL